jgi:hypothetical protein
VFIAPYELNIIQVNFVFKVLIVSFEFGNFPLTLSCCEDRTLCYPISNRPL